MRHRLTTRAPSTLAREEPSVRSHTIQWLCFSWPKIAAVPVSVTDQRHTTCQSSFVEEQRDVTAGKCLGERGEGRRHNLEAE